MTSVQKTPMLLHGNNIFTVRYSNGTSDTVAGTYEEIRNFATDIVRRFQMDASLYCHGTASIWSTITVAGVESCGG